MNDRKSTSGYLFTIGGGAVCWHSATWIRQLNVELNHPPSNATVIHEYNQLGITIAKNPRFHGRTKHIEIKYHFIHKQIQKESVELKYCPTGKIVADILMKRLPQDQFKRLRDMAGVKEIRKQQPEKREAVLKIYLHSQLLFNKLIN